MIECQCVWSKFCFLRDFQSVRFMFCIENRQIVKVTSKRIFRRRKIEFIFYTLSMIVYNYLFFVITIASLDIISSQTFTQIYIYLNATTEMKLQQGFLSFNKDHNEYSILNISCLCIVEFSIKIRGLHIRSLGMKSFHCLDSALLNLRLKGFCRNI